MGVPHSTIKFLGCKPEDEEDGGGERPVHYITYGDSSRPSETLPISSTWSRLICIYNAVKLLLQKFRLVFFSPSPRKTAEPILPIQNQEASAITEPLLVQTNFLSLPTNDSSAESSPERAPATSAFVANVRTHGHELGLNNVDAQQWPQGNYSANKCLVAYLSAREETDEKNPPDDVPFVEEREEEKVKRESIMVVPKERWIKHYSSSHRILLVGDGDFSFSASLAVAFGYAPNITATSLDSEAFLKQNYSRAPSNIEKLKRRGSKVMHEIDATKMAHHPLLGHLKYDRIIFNFPYAGLRNVKNLSRESQLRCHRRLVEQFLQNARDMINENGEIHISHKCNLFHLEFKLESIASSCRLWLIEEVQFNYLNYPGYRTKCGFGGDGYFHCNPSKTYKFGHVGT